MVTFTDLLTRRQDDEATALLFENEVYTWRALVEASRYRAELARRLRRPGPFHIGILLDNVPEFLFWIGGAAFAGAAVVGINPTRRGAELAADIRHTDCQMLLTDRHHLPLVQGLDLGIGPDRLLVVDDPGWSDTLASDHGGGGPTAPGTPVDERTTLLLLFTSGSTGAPKAVVCSQGRLAGTAQTAAALFGFGDGDVLYQAMPLFHGNALMANWAPAVALGAPVALARRFTASGFLPDVRRFGATYCNYVGRALAYILATPEADDDADNPLRLAFGTEASARDMERFSARFGCQVVESYGSSEGAITIRRQPGAPEASLGLPPDLPTMDIIIADPETPAECPRARFDTHGGLVNGHEAIGEIVNRAGVPLFEGYYRNADADGDRVGDGWYRSGDLGYRDEDGWFYFAGRGSDWLRVDSENFAAAPIERILSRWPPVVMAAVYPVPDVRTGDQVMAALELEGDADLDPDELGAFLARQPDLGTKWAPRYVRCVSAMPLTANNKVDKKPLRGDGWRRPTRLWWRPGTEPVSGWRPMTRRDVEGLLDEVRANGRQHLLVGP
ncbi:MAG: AMP-binding protein [Acidimicrobiia bacterium]|nr:AMP-binding protein [Acidimicrobiia bacterium]